MNLTTLSQRKPAAAAVLLFSAIIFHAPLLFADLAYPTRDLFLHYSWVEQVARSLQEGNWYPRWMPLAADGLGQPVFYYYSPLFHLAAGLLSQVTASHWTAMKLVLLASSWLTGWFAYLFARRHATTGPWPILAGVCLQITPLMAVVFWRTAGWSWYTSFPLFVALLYWTFDYAEKPARFDPRISLAVALLAATHVLSAFVALLCLPMAVLWDRDGGSRWSDRLRALCIWGASCLLGLGLAAIYLYPALSTLSLVSPGRWGGEYLDWHSSFAFSTITAFQFGVRWPVFQWIVPLFALAPVVAAMFALRNAAQGNLASRQVIRRLIAVSAMGLFFSSEISYPLWKIFPPLQFVQFPSRFLFVTTAAGLFANVFCLAPLGTLKKFGNKRAITAAPILASIVAALIVTGYLAATGLKPVEPSSGLSELRPGVPEYVPNTAGPGRSDYALQGGINHECASLGLACQSLLNESQHRVWAIESPGMATVRLPVLAFPAWRLTVDGAAVQDPIDPGTGLYRVTLTPGAHQISLSWAGLPEEQTGALLGWISALLCLALCTVRFRSPAAWQARR